MSRTASHPDRARQRTIIGTPLTALVRRGWPRLIVVIVIALVAVVAGSLALWAKVRLHVQSLPEYMARASDIEITPTPPWIQADVKAEVIRDAGLPPQLSILDERLASRLTQAFSLHPWVASVAAVKTSYPVHIAVSLRYRRPVAMVEVSGGLLPIDAEGVLLPTEDFTPEAARDYPRIAGVTGSPLGPIGTRWGDPKAEAAAKLAELLAGPWKSLRLHRLLVGEETTADSGRHLVLSIVTLAGTRLLWGSPAGSEAASELKAAEKMKRLEQFAAGEGGLDALPPQKRDLRR